MIILLSLLICIIGLIVYIISNHPKAQTIGLWSYGIGLLAFLLRFAGTIQIPR